ncbi:adhesive plaque matrix protein-like [Daphnia pulex]|uniref:adhesive plaque matrix protein-like n=1 Tax=Daphnia pulex TaxID=6669 RepID=UPI001EDDF2AE|nr:adhesive plaque matrix protein-like [Daphnia pulex]
MHYQFAIVLVLVGVGAFAQPQLPKPPGYSPAPPKPYPTQSYEPLMPYSFGYAVSDGPSYNNYAHQETADTKAVTGSYRVSLPDGRTQIVTYKADDNGYVANVKYEGQAKYPENYSKPKPAYQPGPPPPPAYKPATPIKPYKP